jgi:CBS domain-containing protein
MKLKDIMTENVEVVGPDTSLYAAARKMRDLDVGALPVCDGERLVGILTDRDLTVRAVAEGRDPKSEPVSESMTPGIAYCFEDQTAAEAEHVMAEKQIRRLPVLNRDKRLVGIVSLGDLATKTDEARAVGKTLEKVSEPAAREPSPAILL